MTTQMVSNFFRNQYNKVEDVVESLQEYGQTERGRDTIRITTMVGIIAIGLSSFPLGLISGASAACLSTALLSTTAWITIQSSAWIKIQSVANDLPMFQTWALTSMAFLPISYIYSLTAIQAIVGVMYSSVVLFLCTNLANACALYREELSNQQ